MRHSSSAGDKLFMAVLLALSACYVLVFWSDPIGVHVWSPLGVNMINGDSDAFFSSQSASLYHPLGYVVFVEIVQTLFGTVGAIPRTQLVVLAVSVVFLGWALDKAIARPQTSSARSRAWICLCVVAMLGLCAIPRFHAYVLSEGLFAPLLFFLMGSAALFAAKPSAGLAAAGASLFGVLIIVRFAAWFLLPVWPFLLWLVHDRRTDKTRRIVVAAAVPFVLVLGIEAVARQARWDASGMPADGYASRRAFGKALMLDSESALPPNIRRDSAVADFVADARRSMAPLRDLVRRAPDWRIRAIILKNAEAMGENRGYRRLFAWRLDDLVEARSTSTKSLRGEVAWSILAAEPAQWASNAWTHWMAHWLHYSVNDAELARLYASYVEEVGDDLVYRDGLVANPPAIAPEPGWMVLADRVWTTSALLASLVVLVLAIRQRLRTAPREGDGGLIMAAVAALAVHAQFFGISIVTHAHLRYAIVFAPLQGLYCLLLAEWAMRRLRGGAGVPADTAAPR